jgi:hypothetical protein
MRLNLVHAVPLQGPGVYLPNEHTIEDFVVSQPQDEHQVSNLPQPDN